MHGEIKRRREKRNRERGVGGGGERDGEKGTECDIGVHFSSTASHPVRETVEDLKKKKKKTQIRPTATARRGMFLGRLNLDPMCCTINPD